VEEGLRLAVAAVSELFDERKLRAAIVAVWGEHGAHVDVFDHMLTRMAKLTDIAKQNFEDGYKLGLKTGRSQQPPGESEG
jgi:hypothetical protein